MCATCGCGRPKDKHGYKTLAEANRMGLKHKNKKSSAKKRKEK